MRGPRSPPSPQDESYYQHRNDSQRSRMGFHQRILQNDQDLRPVRVPTAMRATRPRAWTHTTHASAHMCVARVMEWVSLLPAFLVSIASASIRGCEVRGTAQLNLKGVGRIGRAQASQKNKWR